jgi:VanZ family protein
MTKPNLLYVWAPVVVWCLVIFTFSAIPTLPSAQIIWWDFVIKKSAHIGEYAILYLLVFRALHISGRNTTPDKTKTLIALAFTLLYAISDEYHQGFTPGRTPHIRDIGFDLTGMLLAIYYIYSSAQIFPKLWRYKQHLFFHKIRRKE